MSTRRAVLFKYQLLAYLGRQTERGLKGGGAADADMGWADAETGARSTGASANAPTEYILSSDAGSRRAVLKWKPESGQIEVSFNRSAKISLKRFM